MVDAGGNLETLYRHINGGKANPSIFKVTVDRLNVINTVTKTVNKVFLRYLQHAIEVVNFIAQYPLQKSLRINLDQKVTKLKKSLSFSAACLKQVFKQLFRSSILDSVSMYEMCKQPFSLGNVVLKQAFSHHYNIY